MNRSSRWSVRILAAASVVTAVCSAGVVGASADVPAATSTQRTTSPPPSVGLFSGFDFDSEGWTAWQSGDPTFWENTGGNPGGNLAAQRGVNAATGPKSPPSWAGNRVGLLGGTLSFDLKLGSGVVSPYFEMFLDSSDPDIPYIYIHISNPNSDGTLPNWTHFSFAIKPKGQWLINQSTGVRKADFVKVLSHLTDVGITGGTNASSDTLYVDNVKLASKVALKTSLGYKSKRFYGKLSPAGGCAEKRSVTLYRVRPGPDTKAGTAKTTNAGEWAINRANPTPGSYYAVVKAGFVEGGGDCSAARSLTLKVS